MSDPTPIIEIPLRRKKKQMAKLVVSTEKWNTTNGEVYKAVVRTADGKFVGATNQTKGIPVKQKRRVSRFSLMGK
jgi:hypothetical protein